MKSWTENQASKSINWTRIICQEYSMMGVFAVICTIRYVHRFEPIQLGNSRKIHYQNNYGSKFSRNSIDKYNAYEINEISMLIYGLKMNMEYFQMYFQSCKQAICENEFRFSINAVYEGNSEHFRHAILNKWPNHIWFTSFTYYRWKKH